MSSQKNLSKATSRTKILDKLNTEIENLKEIHTFFQLGLQ